MMNTTATVAMAKKMPRRRSVSMPTPNPSRPPKSAPRRDLQRKRRRQPFEKQHSGIGADAEESRRAEVNVAGVAAEDVPCGREHHRGEHDVAGEEKIFVDRNERKRHSDDENHGGADPVLHLPNNPCGRMPSTIRRRLKATAGAHDAPNCV